MREITEEEVNVDASRDVGAHSLKVFLEKVSIIAVPETKIDLGEAVPGKLTALCKEREEIESRKSSSFEYLINVKFEF